MTDYTTTDVILKDINGNYISPYVNKLGGSTVGNETTPIYLDGGVATSCKQTAITIYNNTKTYSENEIVLIIDSNNLVRFYKSLVNNNTASLSDTTKWSYTLIDENIPVNNIPATGGTVTLSDNTIYTGTISGNITFSLPVVSDATIYHQIKAMLYLPVVTINWGTTHYIGVDAPDVAEAGQYMIYWDYVPNINDWAVGAIKVG